MQISKRLVKTMRIGFLLWLGVAVQALAAQESADAFVAKLRALRPDLPIAQVHPSPLPGFFAVELAGGTFLYGSADGRHLFAGDLYALDDTLVNVTDQIRAGKRKDSMAKVPRSEMVVFSPQKPALRSVFVFTDVDCGYCRKLHQEMKDINGLGIEVRYLAFPREGIDSDAYRKIVSAWCADDRQTALTRLKAGQPVPSKQCPNPVADQYALARELGITGTPAIITESG
jgi:thiol:disulfide interchange protein DsbC